MPSTADNAITSTDVSQAYSYEKATWHMDKIQQLRRGEQIVPCQIQLVLSDFCQQSCKFCGYRRPDGFSSEQFGAYINGVFTNNPYRMIPTAKALEILDDAANLGVKAIQYTGGGEPTVHPDHLSIFAHAQALGLETALVSNGIILRDGWAEIYPRMAWIRISIDAGTPDTYGAVRQVPPSFYGKALDHVSQIRDAIESVRSPCLLGCGYVITLDNWHEVYAGVRRIKEAGAHNVRLSAMFSKQGDRYYGKAIPGIQEEISKALMLQDEHFQIINMFGDRISDLQQHAPDYEKCYYQEFNFYIGGNMKIFRCCVTSYTAQGEVGDLSQQRLSDWFASEQKHRAYGDFKASSCQVCQFNGKNRAILYAIDPAPVHVNFV